MTAPITVAISGVSSPIEVYGGVTACSDYLGGSVGDGPTAWAALPTTATAGTISKSSVLVAASRYVDQQGWQGVPTFLLPVAPSNPTTLQWPRSGVLNADGSTLDSTIVPLAILEAVFEFAAILCTDTTAKDAADTGSNIQSMKAGSASLSFWRPVSMQDGNATQLPTVLMRLVGQWLGNAVAVAAAISGVSSGLSGNSHFGGCCSSCGCNPCSCGLYNYTRAWPF